VAMDSIQKHGTVLTSFVNDVMLACQSLRSIVNSSPLQRLLLG
jgi:hypothetical protein